MRFFKSYQDKQGVENVLAASITGLSMQSARELSYRVAGKEGILLSTCRSTNCAKTLQAAFKFAPYMRRSNISESGDRLEALPFATIPNGVLLKSPLIPYQAVETAFDEGDRQTRHRQRSRWRVS